ncbi:MAG: cytochrome b/b6 domain-containing protein [Raoultibacter sp.]|jgi:formate dehydrogenase subunit gamma
MTRYIQRHSRMTRIVHNINLFCCMWLAISGLFVFVPALGNLVGADVVQILRVSHRVIGVIFIINPIVAMIASSKGFKHFVAKYTKKWDADDKTWMKKFIPYMFTAKTTHMPDQDEVKSGQVVADGALMVLGFLMGMSGLFMWLGTSVWQFPAGAIDVLRLLHDVGYILLIVFVIAHIFLGLGIFQPYRRTARLMFRDGKVSESDALYHWGKWARKELEEKKNISEE